MNSTPSTGNVFRDLGFDEAEAQDLQERSNLMISLLRIIRRQKLSHKKAAELFGVTVAKINDLEAGHIGNFALEELACMLAKSGHNSDGDAQTPNAKAG